MTAQSPSIPNPIARPATIRVTDFDGLVRLFASWEGSFEQLTCGRVESTLRVARGRDFHAHLAVANQAIRVRGRERPGVHTLTLVLPESAGCVWHGRRLDSGCLVVRSGDVEVDHLTSRRATNLSMTVSDDVLRQAARAVTRTDPGSVSWAAVNPAPELFGRLESRIRQFLFASAGPSFLGSPYAHQLDQACLAAAVEAIVPVPDGRRPDLPSAARSIVVCKAEVLMRARLRLPIGEIDICAELGVSGRTLRLAFRERFGLGPMAYYQSLRLNAARAAIKAADPNSMSVAVIARDLGFYHPGKFSGYYRRLFGEVPSETVFATRPRRPVPVAW
jgi:AraC family transcriptional regulator, ethanolamine operon transcriptional activator